MEIVLLLSLMASAMAGIFLLLDSVLAVIFGKRYMLWGLEYTPRAYSDLIHRIATLPAPTLMLIKIMELLAGIALLTVVVYYTLFYLAST